MIHSRAGIGAATHVTHSSRPHVVQCDVPVASRLFCRNVGEQSLDVGSALVGGSGREEVVREMPSELGRVCAITEYHGICRGDGWSFS